MSIIFLLIKLFSERLCPMDGGGVVLEETMCMRIEMFDEQCIDLQ